MRTSATVSAMQMETGDTMPVTSSPRSSSTERRMAAGCCGEGDGRCSKHCEAGERQVGGGR